ncbi:protein of unknown function [Cupriavidus taiwanensis]|nr:protein of unknown function [Cupriavidus taiwanensis]
MARGQAQVDPVHAVLCREDGDLLQRRQLVAGARGRVGKAGGDLVGPLAALGEHVARGRVHEALELGRGAAHVGRRAEDDGIDLFQGIPVLVDVLDRDQQAFGARDAAGAARDGLGLAGGVAVAAVVDDGNAGGGGGHDFDPFDFENLNIVMLRRLTEVCGLQRLVRKV